jgi:enoyl-CoA hydratase
VSDARFDVDGSIAFLTFDRPAARNAMTWEMYQALVDACEKADADTNVRVLALRGAGGAFVAGTDIGQFTTFFKGGAPPPPGFKGGAPPPPGFKGGAPPPPGFGSAADGLAYEKRLDEVIDRLEAVTKPTLAQVQGVATGGGCAIALACDIRIVTPDAKFGVPIARTLGNCLSAANYARLLDLLGPARTKDLLFTGRLIDAAEASHLGLVNRIVEADALDAAVRDYAALVSAHAPLTLRATKEMIHRLQVRRRIDRAEADDLIALCYTSEDFQEGVTAFLEKRKPVWKGK